ncbi:hypothetical protein [Gorillibacterium sp. CAU 1737]|uniref:hypothetical protein n=1 Tax=Gorillibacterium sp. CAU 1737 TaxID=3140362 RepID=UPI003261C57D
MPIWLRVLIIVVILVGALSFIWFLLGSTAYFQRGMDIIGTTYLLIIGIPVLLCAAYLTTLLTKSWNHTSDIQYTGIAFGLVISVLLSTTLIHSVNSHGWTKGRIDSDSLKNTSDGKYEYRIDIINLFQRNSTARLYVKDASSGEEKIIPVGIQTYKISGIRISKTNHWIELEPTDDKSHYILSTTEDLPIPKEVFEIDIKAGTSRKLN